LKAKNPGRHVHNFPCPGCCTSN